MVGSMGDIIDKYENHPSKYSINKDMINSMVTFTFQPVTKKQTNKAYR